MAVSLRESLVTIWRVENECGEGPFQHAETKKFLGELGLLPIGDPSRPDAHSDTHLCEIFRQLQLEADYKNWLFGVEDKAHYDLWFGDADIQEILACGGFELKQYKVVADYVHSGTNQCVFWRPAAIDG